MKLPCQATLFLSLSLTATAPLLLTSCDTAASRAAASAQEDLELLERSKAKLEAEFKRLREETGLRQSELLKRNTELQNEADGAKAQNQKLQDQATQAQQDLEAAMAKFKIE